MSFPSVVLRFGSVVSLEQLAISCSSKLYYSAISGRKSCFSDRGPVRAWELHVKSLPRDLLLTLRLWSIKLITLQPVLHRNALTVIEDEACTGERWGAALPDRGKERLVLRDEESAEWFPGVDKEDAQEWSSCSGLIWMDTGSFFFFSSRAIS